MLSILEIKCRGPKRENRWLKGLENKEIASRVDMPRQIVSKWRKRFFEQRLAGLQDCPGCGRPSRFSPKIVVQIKALACELPCELCEIHLSTKYSLTSTI